MMKLLLLVVIFMLVGSNEGDTRIRQKRSDDTSTTALENVVQQQGALIQQLGTQVQTLSAKLIALEKRLPSTFTPVAFTVHFSHDDGNNGIALGPHQVLKFDSVVTNIGAGYSVQTGIFTAPVSGVYSFFLTIMSTNAHGNVHVALVRDGTALDVVFAEGQSDVYDQGSTQVTTHLRSGQQVWARQNNGDAVRGGWWTIFTGYMMQADV
ncbi:hypothetical protein C0Q70_17067 [Pomacea canaliculata]|uniref:C1q domain-containing protein n=1 Tax=Pomacea canaliculata TaxID=400727 RepID=A0A2T7NRM4_POMCA|nr:complement C1q-like protein 2 [Pomacea canaliculata]PVD23793.1 hypothetical protein C0Q70_17067 [Pomacea canaliculata]